MSNYFLIHYGVAHDENPPGRGSGRYAWGSGIKSLSSKIKGKIIQRDLKQRLSKRYNKNPLNKMNQKYADKEIAKWEAKRRKRDYFNDLKEKSLKRYEDELKEYLDEIKKSDPKEYEYYRQQVLKYGDATDVSIFKGHVTNEEYRNAIDRITFERRIDSLKESEKVTAQKVIDNTMQNLNKVNNWTSTAIKTYQNYETVRKIVDSKRKETDQKKNKSG